MTNPQPLTPGIKKVYTINAREKRNAREAAQKGSLLHCWGKYAVSGHYQIENTMEVISKTNQVLPQALDISVLEQSQGKTILQKQSCHPSSMFPLFTINPWKPPKAHASIKKESRDATDTPCPTSQLENKWNHAICGTWIQRDDYTRDRESEESKYHRYHLHSGIKHWYKWTSVLTEEWAKEDLDSLKGTVGDPGEE